MASNIDIGVLGPLLAQTSQKLVPGSVPDVLSLSVFVAGLLAYASRGTLWDKADSHYHVLFERPQLQNSGLSQKQKSTRNIAQKLDESSKDCVVFWGSQSGTAEGFASRLAKEIHSRYSLDTLTADLSDYDSETISQLPQSKLVVFLLSTYGEGDPSDNAAGLWEWINKTSDSLANVRYVSFGLGNSNYKHYNQVVDVVTSKLDQLGATSLLPVYRADDAERSTEEDFFSWKEEVFRMLRDDLKYAEQEPKYEPALSVVEDPSLDLIDLHVGEPTHSRDNPKAAQACSPIKPLTIKDSREIFHSKTRNCIHMELDLADQRDLIYKTGDHLAVWPTNPDAEVEQLLHAIGYQTRKDVPLLLQALDKDTRMKVPSPTTAAVTFRSYLEICAPISRDTVLGIAPFAPSDEAKEYLLKLGKDRAYFTEFTSHTQLTLGRLLSLAAPNATWTFLPLSYIIETLPAIQPRYYSISSSSVISPRRIAITALVTADNLSATAPLSTSPSQLHGVTTNYLLSHADTILPPTTPRPTNTPKYTIASGPQIHAHIRKSKFKLPISKMTPIIMVAAGTGLAPFRAFIAERARHAQNSGLDSVGPMLLFFGCRNPEEDFIYQSEIEEWQAQMGEKLKVVTAFSRVAGQKKLYVQDRVEEYGEDVVRLLNEQRASLFVCGRTVMGKEVASRVAQVAGKVKGLESEKAGEWVEGLRRTGKWREDVWG